MVQLNSAAARFLSPWLRVEEHAGLMLREEQQHRKEAAQERTIRGLVHQRQLMSGQGRMQSGSWSD